MDKTVIYEIYSDFIRVDTSELNTKLKSSFNISVSYNPVSDF